MTEREMLEAAARAAGLDIDHDRYDEDWGYAFRGKAKFWNPRNCSFDSFELAAALRISVEHSHAEEARPWVCASIDGGPLKLTKAFVEDVPDESQRADRTRLVILRCAAAQSPKEQA